MSLQILEVHQYDLVTTRYLVQDKDNKLHWGTTGLSIDTVRQMDPTQLNTHQLDPDKLYPRYQPHMTRFEQLETPEVHIKRQRFLDNDNFLVFPEHFKHLTLREVETSELLANNPHTNVCQYLGVVCDNEDRIVGVAYKRYKQDLQQLVASGQHCSSDHILKSVQKGMKHMHHLGLVHCDIRPENIFVTGRQVVIGDFDSTHKLRQKITYKIGAPGWWNPDFNFGDKVDKEIDLYSIKQLRLWLEEYAKDLKREVLCSPQNL